MDTEIKNNNLDSKRGFTLIELLAVIVVLAIVMLIAVNAIFPQVDTARRRAFSVEANGVIKSVNQYILTEISTSGLVIHDGDCITIAKLVDKAQSELDKNKYNGKVIITKSGDKFLYSVYLTNSTFMVVGKGVDTNKNQVSISETDVVDYSKDSWDSAMATQCTEK